LSKQYLDFKKGLEERSIMQAGQLTSPEEDQHSAICKLESLPLAILTDRPVRGK